MPTNRKRTVRHRGGSGTGSISENDLEFMMRGSLCFTGEVHSFKSEKDAKKFYFKYKYRWLFGGLINLILFLSGYQITVEKTEKFHPTHFSKPLTDTLVPRYGAGINTPKKEISS